MLSAAVLLLAVMVGFLAGFDPRLAIGAALAVVLLLVTMHSLQAGLTIFVALSFVELVPGLTGPMVSLSKVAGAVLAVSWIAATAAGNAPRRDFFSQNPVLTVSLLFLLVWTLLSATWAEESSRAFVSTLSFALSFLLFPITYVAIRRVSDVRPILVAYVLGAALAAIYGVIAQPDAASAISSPTGAAGLNRLAGSIGDPNELATLLASGIGVATGLIFDRSRSGAFRVFCGFLAFVLLIAIFVTLSRGGLVSLAAALVAAIAVAPPKLRAGAVASVLAVVAISFVFFFGVASQAARDRITESDGGSGRTDIWKVGWRLVEDNPVLGVGGGNFQVSSIHYLLVPGTIRFDEYIVDLPTVAHNAYLQVLAETGIVGLVLFLVSIGVSLTCAAKALALLRRQGDRADASLAAGVIVGLAALLAGYFFLSEEHSKHLWLLLALGPAMLGAARRAAEGTEPENEPV